MFNFKDTILLTGAGFTANFGGFLAKEMWLKIFNNPNLNIAYNIKLELKKNFDFEAVYSKIIDGRFNFSSDEVKIFEEVLNDAYREMHEEIRGFDRDNFNDEDFIKFLNYFKVGNDNKVGVCFTLNQDLFLERNFNWQPLGTPGMKYDATPTGYFNLNDVDSTDFKQLPTREELENYINQPFKDNYCYIKLHGSLKWRSSDGKNSIILGINKREAISKIPLLEWYFGLFEHALYQKSVKLWIIGYGFNDSHINTCLTRAIVDFGMKIYIISTEDPDKFYFRMTHKYPSGVFINETDETRRPI